MNSADWHNGPFAAFDTETTGVDPETARIVTATIVTLCAGKFGPCRTWLINPGIEIPDEATSVHGVTTEYAREHGRAPIAAIPEIVSTVQSAWDEGTPVVAFNAAYDLTVLTRECARVGCSGLYIDGPVVDPYVIDRQVDKYRRGKRTLTAMCEHYGIHLNQAHDATADATAAARIAWAIANRYPDIAAMPLPDLHAAQIGWHAERQADFAAYLHRVGKPADDVSGHWPIRPAHEGVTR